LIEGKEGLEDYLVDKSALLVNLADAIESGAVLGNMWIHKSLLLELQREAREGLISAEIALDELAKVRELSERLLFAFDVVGEPINRPSIEVELDYCLSHDCTLIVGTEQLKRIAESMNVKVYYLAPKAEGLSIEKFFDQNTMSVHLKEGTLPKAKKGLPGNWTFVTIGDKPSTADELKRYLMEMLMAVQTRRNSFVEIERKGSIILQLDTYRVVVTRPPLSDGWEITVTRPVTKKKLSDYNLDEKLLKRLEERAEGIVIAGMPGMGKTTFAQALAEFYMEKGKVVKTVESPRDMHLPPEITQYSKNYAEVGELHDILLLSRPDYTVYDEMRNDEDFQTYIDLRLAGIGMIGVVHATSPLDAIHRFIRRVDIGTIPNILDTVIFIHSGNVKKVYTLDITVKVPSGMKEADLARPVVEIKDLMTDEVEYEIYVFGEQTMIVPVKKVKPVDRIQARLERLITESIPDAKVEVQDGEYVIVLPKTDLQKFNKKLVSKLKKYEKKYNLKFRVKFANE
jgi:ATPase